MKLKKITALMMAAVLTLSMTACGGGSSDPSDSSSSTATGAAEETGDTGDTGETEGTEASDESGDAGDSYSIGICQMLEHPALDAATEGFQDACSEKFGEGNVDFDLQNAQGEQAMCSTIVNNFVAADVDLILANATLPLQTAAQATGDIPIMGTSITDYATALEISDWTGATGINISGTSDLAPIDEQAAMTLELLPDVKTVGILYCSAEPNSKYQAELYTEAMTENNVECKEFTAADSNEIQSVVTSAIEQCDALYIPTDNTIASNTDIIKNVCIPAKIPVIAGEEGICAGCGVATLSISYYDIGYKAGEMAYDVLANGADITTMDIESAPEVTKMYNEEICQELGITIPDGYEAIEAGE